MGSLTDGLRESAKDMMETANYINKGAGYIDKGTKIAEYWLNGDKRKQIKAQVEKHCLIVWLVNFGMMLEERLCHQPRALICGRSKTKKNECV